MGGRDAAPRRCGMAARSRRPRRRARATTRRPRPPTHCRRISGASPSRRRGRGYPRRFQGKRALHNSIGEKRTRGFRRKPVEVEIGIGKSGRRAYGFDDIAIVPSRRTRDPEDVDITWEVDAYKFELPMMAAAMDGVVSPATAIEIGRLGGLACLNLEGLWTRYEEPGRRVRGDRVVAGREGDAPDAGAVPRADQARADRRAHRGDQGGRRHRVRVAHAAARRAVLEARPRRRARPPRRAGHRRVRRARVARPASASRST